jgi:hypothetical protein
MNERRCEPRRSLKDLGVERECGCGQWKLTNKELVTVPTIQLANYIAERYIQHLLEVQKRDREEINANRT